MNDRIDKLRREWESAKRKAERLHEQRKAAVADFEKLNRKLKLEERRSELIAIKGEEGAAELAHRHTSGNLQPYDTDAATVLEVRRTRCTITFGDGKKWDVPVDYVQAAGVRERGFFLPLRLT